MYLLPPATKLGQCYVFTRVCDSVHRWGVCPIACWDTPPRDQTPPNQAPPQDQTALDTGNKRTVCILLECNLVYVCKYKLLFMKYWKVWQSKWFWKVLIFEIFESPDHFRKFLKKILKNFEVLPLPISRTSEWSDHSRNLNSFTIENL